MQLLPPELYQAIDHAAAEMTADRDHALAPLFRRGIYQTLAWLDPDAKKNSRNWLAIYTAEYVLPTWQQQWPQNIIPVTILQSATAYLVGDLSKIVVQKEAEQSWNQLEALGSGYKVEKDVRVFFAGVAVVQAAFEAISICGFDQIPLHIDDTDEQIDADYSDTARWAAYACAGRSTDLTNDAIVRQSFWLWWLWEAIPKAWHVTQ